MENLGFLQKDIKGVPKGPVGVEYNFGTATFKVILSDPKVKGEYLWGYLYNTNKEEFIPKKCIKNLEFIEV